MCVDPVAAPDCGTAGWHVYEMISDKKGLNSDSFYNQEIFSFRSQH